MGDNHLPRDTRDPRVASSARTRLSLTIGVTATLLTLVLATGHSVADRCASSAEMGTLRVAAFQQQLMVAALACHRIGSYNHFVRAYHTALVSSDRSMLRLFVRLDGTDGDADYDAYKTRLANLAVLHNNASGGAYCREAREDFVAAARNRRPLAVFVATRHLAVRLPFEACENEAPTAVAAREAIELPRAHRHHRHSHRGTRPI